MAKWFISLSGKDGALGAIQVEANSKEEAQSCIDKLVGQEIIDKTKEYLLVKIDKWEDMPIGRFVEREEMNELGFNKAEIHKKSIENNENIAIVDANKR